MARPLSSESIYNELTGEEVKEILITRFADLLSNVPDFQRHLTLPRVKMTLNVRLEVHGRTPPSFQMNDEVTLRINPGSPSLSGGGVDTERDIETVMEINADSYTEDGMAPDQVRVEHSLPVMVPTRGPNGIQDVPTIMEGAIYFKPEVVGKTTTVTLDHGPARMRMGGEGMGSLPNLAEKNSHGGTPDVKFADRVPGKDSD